MEPQSKPAQQTETSQYQFFMQTNQVSSLVMLKNIRQMLPLFKEKQVFIYIDTKKREEELMLLQQETDITFLYFDNVQRTQQYIREKLRNRRITLLASIEFARDIAEWLCPLDEIQTVKIHNIGSELDSTDFEDLRGQLIKAKKKKLANKILFRGNQMVNIIKSFKQEVKEKIRNKLPNVISLTEDGWNCNVILRTVIAMRRQTTPRKKLMQELYELYMEVYGQRNEEFEGLMNDENSDQIIKLYTISESPANWITNNLLKSSRNPSELYYCQPYVKDLFKAISSKYSRNQKQTSDNQQFICYRGGSASFEEISFYQQNEKGIVLNLGFLSTSRNKKKAKTFAKNMFWIIWVKNSQRHKGLDFGYADIRHESNFPDEEEVLFNPLNTFKIEKFLRAEEDDVSIDTVVLTYGSLAELMFNKVQNKSLTSSEKLYTDQGENFLNEINNDMQKQGDTFLSFNEYIEGGTQYWTEELKHVQNLFQMASIYENLGSAYSFKGLLNQALANNSKSIQIKKELVKSGELKENHIVYLRSIQNLADIYDRFGKSVEALQLYKGLLEVDLSGEPSEKVKILLSIAVITNNSGNYEVALKNFKECLEFQQKSFGKNNIVYAMALDEKGKTLINLGKYQQALSVCQEGEEIRSTLYGKNNIHYAYSLSSIGNLLDRIGDYQNALKKLTQCLQIRESVLGVKHPDYLTSLKDIGSIKQKMGKYDQALELYEKCRGAQQTIFGYSHSEHAKTLNEIGVVYQQKGEYQKALYYIKEALGILKRVRGELHPDYSSALCNLSLIYVRMRRYDEATTHYQECLQIHLQIAGKDHQYAIILQNSGLAYLDKGSYSKALNIFGKALQIFDDTVGKKHPHYGTCLSSMGLVYQRKQKYYEALGKFEQSRKITEKALGKENGEYVNLLNSFGLTYLEMGKFQQALIVLKQGLQIAERVLNQGHPICQNLQLHLMQVTSYRFSTLKVYSQLFPQ